MVSVEGGISGGGAGISITVDSVVVAQSSFSASAAGGSGLGGTTIVPTGSTYSVSANSIALWTELY